MIEKDKMFFISCLREEFMLPPAEDSDIYLAEQDLGYKLPPKYIEILKITNGGETKDAKFKVADEYIDFPFFWGVSSGRIPEYAINAEYYHINSLENSELLLDVLKRSWNFPEFGVIFSFFAGCCYMFDYSLCGKSGNPEIIFCRYMQNDNTGRVNVYNIAKSFNDFMSMIICQQ